MWTITRKKVKLCPWGKVTLKSINPQNIRKSCLDEIPTCKSIWGKLLPCGTHHCRQKWHRGPCSLCEVQCTEICRWGKGERKKKCYELHYPIDNIVIFGEEILKSVQQFREKPFRWIKKCNKLKRCKKHRWQNMCWDVVSLSDPSGAHICLETCGKDLPWGKHKCTAFCHTEQCEPWAVYSNVPLSCPCGLTVIPAPVRCGEKPFWFKKCRKIHKEWGHTWGQQWHPGPWPPWTEGVSKSWAWGKETLDNAKWGELQPSWGQICNKELNWSHFWKKMWHNHQQYIDNGEIVNGCGQKCNKKRKNWEHKWQTKCHAQDECPDLPCEAEIKLYWKCGYRYVSSICNRYFEGFEEEEEKKIDCNSEWVKNKRDAQIAKAFTSKNEK